MSIYLYLIYMRYITYRYLIISVSLENPNIQISLRDVLPLKTEILFSFLLHQMSPRKLSLSFLCLSLMSRRCLT